MDKNKSGDCVDNPWRVPSVCIDLLVVTRYRAASIYEYAVAYQDVIKGVENGYPVLSERVYEHLTELAELALDEK